MVPAGSFRLLLKLIRSDVPSLGQTDKVVFPLLSVTEFAKHSNTGGQASFITLKNVPVLCVKHPVADVANLD